MNCVIVGELSTSILLLNYNYNDYDQILSTLSTIIHEHFGAYSIEMNLKHSKKYEHFRAIDKKKYERFGAECEHFGASCLL